MSVSDAWSRYFLPRDLPANQSLERMAADFGVPPSNAVSSVVLVDESGIDADDERYYRELLARLVSDKENVAYVLDTFGNPVTRSIALSPDGKAVTLGHLLHPGHGLAVETLLDRTSRSRSVSTARP